jgi:CheY-like chemotaxis protein
MEIRKLPGSAGAVPIIAVTANALEANVSASKAAGVTSLLEKPITPRGLHDAIQSALSRTGARASVRLAS